MPTVIDELVTILGIEMDGKAGAVVQTFNDSLDKVTKFATTAGAALTATAATIGYFIEKTTRASTALYNFQQLTGISTTKLQGLQYAVEMAGGSADSLQQDLMGLTQSMSSPIPGEFNHALFMLGVNVRGAKGELKSADQVLMDVADKFQRMSKVEQLQWGSRIGLSQDTILLLQQGRKAIQEYQKQAENIPTIVDEKHLKMARDFTIQLTLLRRIVTYISQTAASVAGPILKEIVKDVSEFLRLNQEFIRSGLRMFIEGIIQGFVNFWDSIRMVKEAVYALLPGVFEFIDKMKGAETVGQLVYVILGAIAIAIGISAAGFLLLAAKIGIALVVLDDIITYFRGGESVIGSFIERIKKLYQEFANKFPAIAELIQIVVKSLEIFGGWAWDKIVQGAQKLYKIFLGIKQFVSDITEGLLGWANSKIAGFLSGDFMKGFKETIGYGGTQSTSNTSNTKNEIHINQQISGNNATAIADETAMKTSSSLMNIFPGGLAPTVQ